MSHPFNDIDPAAQEGAGLEARVRDALSERISEEGVQADLGEVFRGAVKIGLELVLEEVLRETVGAAKWAKAKSRVDSYNGGYLRGLLTSMGYIQVRMPRARKGGAPVDVIGAYQRRSSEIDDAITRAYVHGVSTRGMSDVVETLAGDGLSKSSVSRVTARLEEQVEELRTRSLEGREFPYLYLDAIYFKTRWARKVDSVPALVAYGVDEHGKRELLAVEVGTGESDLTWGGLLGRLVARGLDGVLLVISDAHEGIRTAVRTHLPEVPHQRCVVHLMRNVGSHVPLRDGLRKRVLGQVSAIFKGDDLKDAKKRLAKFKERWTKELPEAVKCLEDGFAAATRFFDFPREHHVRIRSSNNIERLNREIRRRIRAVGAFPDRESALRLITAVAVDASRVWGKRRYLDTGLLGR
jgi:transposase-like protein